jgi:hypothetical protein
MTARVSTSDGHCHFGRSAPQIVRDEGVLRINHSDAAIIVALSSRSSPSLKIQRPNQMSAPFNNMVAAWIRPSAGMANGETRAGQREQRDHDRTPFRRATLIGLAERWPTRHNQSTAVHQAHRSVSAPWPDFLAHYVCAITAKADDLLLEPDAGTVHQLSITAVPHLVAMFQRPWHAGAGCLNRMAANRVGVTRGQLAVPINDLWRLLE